MAEIKRVTLHPLNPDGTIDTNTNLYPKTLTTGIVNEEGEAVNFPDDSALVHNSGNENIGGEKTFTSNVNINTEYNNATLGLSTDEGTALGSLTTGEKGTKIVHTDNHPESSYYGKTASFTVDPHYGASFSLYDGDISFTKRAMENPCQARLRFTTRDNVDELHLITDTNDVQTDIVFPAGIDDRVELATKDDVIRHALPRYDIDGNTTIINFINTNGVNGKTIILNISSSNALINGEWICYLLLITGVAPYPSLCGELQKFGNYTNHPRLYFGDTGPKQITINSNITFNQFLTDWIEHPGVRADYQLVKNLTTDISSESTHDKYPSAKAVYDYIAAVQGSKLYKHHFDVVLTHADLALIPENSDVHIQVNALSTSSTPWTTLSQLDGGGFIVSAFGNVPNNYYYVFELKLFYAAAHALMVNFNNLISNTVTPYALTSCGGGYVPDTWPIQDSVTPL